MKESKLIEMSNKVEQVGGILQQVIGELHNLKDLSIGTMELVKRLPGYQDALNELTKEHIKDGKEDSSSTTPGDSGLIITDE